MSYFPIFLCLDEKKVLIIGGGKVASRRIYSLLEFTKNITIVASSIDEDLNKQVSKNNLKVFNRDYIKSDLNGFDIVIVAIDNIKLQEEIYFECKKRSILCNCVDLQRCCDFFFPSFIKEGDLTLAISTNGSSPAFTKRFKSYLKKIIPKDIELFLKHMKQLRQDLPKGKDRMQHLDKKVKEYFDSWS